MLHTSLIPRFAKGIRLLRSKVNKDGTLPLTTDDPRALRLVISSGSSALDGKDSAP